MLCGDKKMKIQLSDTCVYTITTPEKLLVASKFKEPLFELKRWVTAKECLKEAHKNNLEMPIIFADSRDCTNLIGWVSF